MEEGNLSRQEVKYSLLLAGERGIGKLSFNGCGVSVHDGKKKFWK